MSQQLLMVDATLTWSRLPGPMPSSLPPRGITREEDSDQQQSRLDAGRGAWVTGESWNA
jgi:hypothetical protein